MPDLIRIAPSILAADLLHLQDQVQMALNCGADELHVDVMDGHFVPNLSNGPDVVKALRKGFPDAWLDVHLMLSNPEKYLETFAQAGASGLTVHAEVIQSPSVLNRIRELGMEPGLSLKPATPVSAVSACLPLAERVLLMTVEPGFGGQKLMRSCAEKARELRGLGYKGRIACDGGVTFENARELAALGIDTLVMGTAFFRAEDPQAVADMVHSL